MTWLCKTCGSANIWWENTCKTCNAPTAGFKRDSSEFDAASKQEAADAAERISGRDPKAGFTKADALVLAIEAVEKEILSTPAPPLTGGLIWGCVCGAPLGVTCSKSACLALETFA